MTAVFLEAAVVKDVATCLVRKRDLEAVVAVVRSLEVVVMDARMPASYSCSGG